MQALDGYAQRGQPFFIQCSFPDPHHPFTPPGKYWDMYRPEDVELPASFHASAAAGRQPPPHVQWMYAQRDSGRAVKHTPAMFACTEREAREAIALNYGSISHIDHTVGEVLAHLQRLGLADNTVVIFTSDHGDYLGDHQLLWKGPVHYQSVIRTPFIWADPAGAQGARSDALCSTTDIAPTILARAGLLPYNGIQGADLGALMRGEQAAPREAVLIEEEGQRVMFGFDKRVRMRTLQTGRYRMSVYHGVSWGELYDLREDPLELRNLWDEPGSAALRQDLLFQLAQNLIGHGETSPHPTALA